MSRSSYRLLRLRKAVADTRNYLVYLGILRRKDTGDTPEPPEPTDGVGTFDYATPGNPTLTIL